VRARASGRENRNPESGPTRDLQTPKKNFGARRSLVWPDSGLRFSLPLARALTVQRVSRKVHQAPYWKHRRKKTVAETRRTRRLASRAPVTNSSTSASIASVLALRSLSSGRDKRCCTLIDSLCRVGRRRTSGQPSANCRDEHFRRSGECSCAPTLAVPFDSEAARLRRRRFPG